MSDKKQEKKRRRKNSKNNESTKKETKEQRGSAKKMAASSGSGTSTSGSNSLTSGSSDLPSSYPVSSFLNIPCPFPRFPNYSNAPPMASVFPATSLGPQVTPTSSQSQPPPNDFSSQLNFIMSNVMKSHLVEAETESSL